MLHVIRRTCHTCCMSYYACVKHVACVIQKSPTTPQTPASATPTHVSHRIISKALQVGACNEERSSAVTNDAPKESQRNLMRKESHTSGISYKSYQLRPEPHLMPRLRMWYTCCMWHSKGISPKRNQRNLIQKESHTQVTNDAPNPIFGHTYACVIQNNLRGVASRCVKCAGKLCRHQRCFEPEPSSATPTHVSYIILHVILCMCHTKFTNDDPNPI